MQKGKIILISGPSGVGKRTILESILDDQTLNIKYSISATTRPKRENEVHGKDYFFMTIPEFETGIKNGDFIEYATFCQNYYGTPKTYLNREIEAGNNILLEIEVQGVKNIIKMYKPEELVTIFVLPPSLEVLKERLDKRGTESPEIIAKRIETAVEEISNKDLYQYNVVNNELDVVVKEIKDIIKRRINA